MQAPQLKRGLFGYTSKSVHLILADRDARTSEQVRATEAVVLGLRSGAEILKRQRAEQAEKLRALEAEAADLRADRNATRGDLEHAVADATRLGLELTATKGELETVRRDLETTRHEIETARDELDRQERRQGAEEMGGTPSGEIDVLRKELGLARRYFLIQSHRATRAEARIEELEAELRSVRAELDGGLSAATSELEAAHAAVEEAAARRPVPISPAGTEEPSAVLEVAGRTMARIMDGARNRATEELREAERTRRETLAEIERLVAWRDRLTPLVGVVQSTIEDAKERAAGIGDRVDEAVEPLTQAIAALGDRLAALAELAALPDEANREPASERSLLIELGEEEQAAGQRVPAWGSWG
jgi:predicted  nucleic acid-binding Zn-ribbon protein